MKLVSIFTFIILATLNVEARLAFKDTSLEQSVRTVTNIYNKKLDKKNWKAEVIGDRVYFKNKKSILSMKVISAKVSVLVVEVNHQNVTFLRKQTFAQSTEILKKALQAKNYSWFSLFIEEAQAEDALVAPGDMEAALSSAIGWREKYFGWMIESDGELATSKICGLNEAEKKVYSPTLGDQETFLEIKFLIQLQEKYIRDAQGVNIEDVVKSYRQPDWMSKMLGCIKAMAVRRQHAIEGHEENGFACFQVYEKGQEFLDNRILEKGMVPYSESLSAKKKSAQEELMIRCESLPEKYQVKNCQEQHRRILNKLYADCPQGAGEDSDDNFMNSNSESGAGSANQ